MFGLSHSTRGSSEQWACPWLMIQVFHRGLCKEKHELHSAFLVSLFPSFDICKTILIKQSIQSVFEDAYKVYHNVLLYIQYLKLELASLNNGCSGGSSCFGGEMALAWESGDPGLSQI